METESQKATLYLWPWLLILSRILFYLLNRAETNFQSPIAISFTQGLGRLVIRFLANDVISGRMRPAYHFLLVFSSRLPQRASELGSSGPRTGWLLGEEEQGMGTRLMDVGV